MAYSETVDGPLTTIIITCDVREKWRICGNTAQVTRQDRDAALMFLLDLGWRLRDGHQVCGSCLARGKAHFPRVARKERG